AVTGQELEEPEEQEEPEEEQEEQEVAALVTRRTRLVACLEVDESAIQHADHWVYKGKGQGSYEQKSSMEFMGAGRGAYEREVMKSSARCRPACLAVGCCGLLVLLGLLAFFLFYRPEVGQSEVGPDCVTDYHDWQHLWTMERRSLCCRQVGRGCSPQDQVVHVPVPQPSHIHYVPVPVPSPSHSHVVYHTHYIHSPDHVIYVHDRPPNHFTYDCHAGYSNWYFGWSLNKKSWCCGHQGMGCPGTWKGSFHLHTNVHITHGVGHAHGRIYDCEAGFSNWMQGWSDSKKDWCCDKANKGCVKFHCTGEAQAWHGAKQEWCCENFQKGCPHTTLSPLKCDATCTFNGETSKCMDRIQWAAKNAFSGKADACNLAYSKIQVECDVCRACSIQEAGCGVHGAASDPFDCLAALNNFFRAWSPEKKHWCCTKQGRGCEGSSPPAVDAGAGMMWKHVQVNGYWTWQAVSAGGAAVQSLPYDCHAGLPNWHTG
ncbi:unnamed protein product, partial [Effrenium voratum]